VGKFKDARKKILQAVEYYNNERYHESLENCTPADVYTGRNVRIIKERQRIKERTMKLRKRNYKKAIARAQTVA